MLIVLALAAVQAPKPPPVMAPIGASAIGIARAQIVPGRVIRLKAEARPRGKGRMLVEFE